MVLFLLLSMVVTIFFTMTANVVVNVVRLFFLICECLICTNQLLSRDSIAWKFSFSNHSKEFVRQ